MKSDQPRTLTSAGRRDWLHAMLELAAVGLVGSTELCALAADDVTVPEVFMALSQALTGRGDLDRAMGARLFEILQKSTPGLQQRLSPLAGALAAGNMDAASQALALRIMGGWYLGQIDGVVVAYEQALMFDVVTDVLVIPTYCPGAPGFWAAKPIERVV